MLRSALAAAVIVAISGSQAIAAPFPSFDDFPSDGIYSGHHVPPDLSSRDAYSFRTRLREAAREAPNFAGEYVLEQWGCGTDCGTGAVVDVRTGKVDFLPSIIGQQKDDDLNIRESPVQFSVESKLLVLIGQMNEKGPFGRHFYEITPDGFIYLGVDTSVSGVNYSDDRGQYHSTDDSAAAKNSEPTQARSGKAGYQSPDRAAPIEDDAVLFKDTEDDLKLIDNLVEIARSQGFKCSSVSSARPMLMSHGFVLGCDHFSYIYDIQDKGRGWEVSPE